MKKALGVAAVVMLLAATGVASANSIIVPFFNDGPAGGLPTRFAAFVQIKNLEAEPIIVFLEYADMNGVDCTPAEATFELAGGTALGFRPLQDDPAYEGADGSPPRLVPNAAPNGTMANGLGGMTIYADGRIAGAAVLFDDTVGRGWAYPAMAMPE